ncbi:hypothetical protein E2C01_077334 [Portunus trituberculatus]|uniref:Uncharacterized protein n=1 Tax=Portunus trituberculatus TaxID=210409 RepID=A0A5B7IPG3_PORTR|nr:hypothetical protein [Portunus trituberculatus]
MGGPSEISVARLDLPLEPEVVLAAQDEVLNALDVSRVGRIFEMELEKIFEEDNVVQNLEKVNLAALQSTAWPGETLSSKGGCVPNDLCLGMNGLSVARNTNPMAHTVGLSCWQDCAGLAWCCIDAQVTTDIHLRLSPHLSIYAA